MSYSQDGTSYSLHFGSLNAGHHGKGNEEQVLEQNLNKIASLTCLYSRHARWMCRLPQLQNVLMGDKEKVLYLDKLIQFYCYKLSYKYQYDSI